MADHSSSHWVTCFQDTATEVLGVDAQELGAMRDSDEAAFDEVFQKANFKDFTFKIRAKMDTFNVSYVGTLSCNFSRTPTVLQ